jgi:predicted GIY-YIG superfamily endonuclease
MDAPRFAPSLSFPRKRESILIKEDRYFVYILASKRNGTLRVGVTSNLAGRTYEHKQDLRDGFTKNTACIDWSGSKSSATRHPARKANQEMAARLED